MRTKLEFTAKAKNLILQSPCAPPVEYIKRMGASVMAGALMNNEIFQGVVHLKQKRYLPGDTEWNLEDDDTTAAPIGASTTSSTTNDDSKVEGTRPIQPVEASAATSRVSSNTAANTTSQPK